MYCQGGGYFGGSRTVSARASTAATITWRARSGTCSHPTTIVDEAGASFEFDHDWAESFVRLQCGDETGLAHFECVVIREPAP